MKDVAFSRPLKCFLCLRRFKYKLSLEDHVRSDHDHVISLINRAVMMSQNPDPKPTPVIPISIPQSLNFDMASQNLDDEVHNRIGQAVSVIKR